MLTLWATNNEAHGPRKQAYGAQQVGRNFGGKTRCNLHRFLWDLIIYKNESGDGPPRCGRAFFPRCITDISVSANANTKTIRKCKHKDDDQFEPKS